MWLKLNCYQLRENYKSLCKPQGNHKEKPTIYTHTQKEENGSKSQPKKSSNNKGDKREENKTTSKQRANN